jgi:hypothetical protein
MSLAPCLANRVTKLITLDRSRDQEGTHCDSSNILLLYLVQDMDARSAMTKCQIRSGHMICTRDFFQGCCHISLSADNDAS